MATPRQTTPEGDALIAQALREAEADTPTDPTPPDAPLAGATDDAPPKPKRGRPPGSKNATGRRSRVSKLDEIAAAAHTAIQRGALLASFMVMQAPLPPDRKVVYLNDAEIVGSPKGREALVGCLRFACERNSKVQTFCSRMIEASAYTGIGATVVFGLVLPIAMNHGVFDSMPAPLLAMMRDEDDSASEPFMPEGSE